MLAGNGPQSENPRAGLLKSTRGGNVRNEKTLGPLAFGLSLPRKFVIGVSGAKRGVCSTELVASNTVKGTPVAALKIGATSHPRRSSSTHPFLPAGNGTS